MTAVAVDEAHLAAALALGRRSLGETSPNPAVGCVIVDGAGRVAGRGRTAPGGRPHAETVALAAAGGRARGGTAYVTLEPCSHHGVTPPCVDALLEAGIVRVVAGARDPDPRVDGRGFARLRSAGIAVETGLLPDRCDALLLPFATRIRLGRPRVTLKLAASLDGRIALRAGAPTAITGPATARHVHALRAAHDAVLVGIGTALADDPLLTARLPGSRTGKLVRVVVDRALRLPLASRLVATASCDPLWVLHRPDAEPARVDALRAHGVRLLPYRGDVAAALAVLGAAGLNGLLVEGGARLAAALLAAELVDELVWYAAPRLLGPEAVPAIAAGTGAGERLRLVPLETGRVGDDMWLRFAAPRSL